MGFYTRLARPALFTLPPERAQRLAEGLLRQRWLWRWADGAFRVEDDRLGCEMAGIPLRNPVGLAAGYDKDCRALAGLARLGFGYLVGGTVFPVPRAGNPRPRLRRIPEREALVNALGFPSSGAEAVARNLDGLDPDGAAALVSISALEAEDFVSVFQRLAPLVRGVELNISSPNTAGLAVFQEPRALGALLQAVNRVRPAPRAERDRKPLLVKLPAGYDDASRKRVLDLAAVCLAEGADGVTAGNTWPMDDPQMGTGRGGLSGRPLLKETLKTVAAVRELAEGTSWSGTGRRFAVNACGGVFTGEDAHRALQAGADTVQVYTALVYRGPYLVKRMLRELLACMEGAERP